MAWSLKDFAAECYVAIKAADDGELLGFYSPTSEALKAWGVESLNDARELISHIASFPEFIDVKLEVVEKKGTFSARFSRPSSKSQQNPQNKGNKIEVED